MELGIQLINLHYIMEDLGSCLFAYLHSLTIFDICTGLSSQETETIMSHKVGPGHAHITTCEVVQIYAQNSHFVQPGNELKITGSMKLPNKTQFYLIES